MVEAAVASREIGLRGDFALHAQDGFADFAAAIIDNRRLPVAVGLLQLFEERAGKT